MWLKYRLFFGSMALVVYTFCVWHITETYHKVDQLSTALTNVTYDKALGEEISKKLSKDLQTYASKAKPITQNIYHETITNPVYSDCKSTDGVLRSYQDKLNNQ